MDHFIRLFSDMLMPTCGKITLKIRNVEVLPDKNKTNSKLLLKVTHSHHVAKLTIGMVILWEGMVETPL